MTIDHCIMLLGVSEVLLIIPKTLCKISEVWSWVCSKGLPNLLSGLYLSGRMIFHRQFYCNLDFIPLISLTVLVENWRRWRQRFELYLLKKEAHEKADKIIIAMLLSATEPEALERYNHFTWPEPVEGDEENKAQTSMRTFSPVLNKNLQA